MTSLRRSVPSSERWRRAAAIGVGLSLFYSAIVFGYSVHPASNVSISGSAWQGFALYSLLALGTVGVPVVLWLGHDIRSPAVLLAFLLVFWHVLVEFPPIGTGRGDAPGFLFVFVWVPFYLVAYGLLAVGEWWFRNRGVSVLTSRRPPSQ